MKMVSAQDAIELCEVEEGSTQETEMETKSGYHELYLQAGALEYIAPIKFEDEMDWDECELYYACIYDGVRSFRSNFHLKRTAQIRRPSKKQLQQYIGGKLESCLRSSDTITSYKPHRPSMRRAISFNILPNIDCPYSQCLADTKKDEFSSRAHVHFDDYVSVATTTPFDDYPSEIQNSLWMTKKEMDDCVRGATKEAALRRANAKHRALQASKKKRSLATASISSPPSSVQQQVTIVFEEQKQNSGPSPALDVQLSQ